MRDITGLGCFDPTDGDNQADDSACDHLAVRLTLNSDGLGPATLGMTRTEIGEILKTWGTPKAFSRGASEEPGLMLILPEVTIFAYCDQNGSVNAIELARPDDPDTTVEFDHVDLSGSPADTVLAELQQRDHRVLVTENGYSATLPDVLLAFWRNGEPTDPPDRSSLVLPVGTCRPPWLLRLTTGPPGIVTDAAPENTEDFVPSATDCVHCGPQAGKADQALGYSPGLMTAWASSAL